jgi:hypothetical protein
MREKAIKRTRLQGNVSYCNTRDLLRFLKGLCSDLSPCHSFASSYSSPLSFFLCLFQGPFLSDAHGSVITVRCNLLNLISINEHILEKTASLFGSFVVSERQTYREFEKRCNCVLLLCSVGQEFSLSQFESQECNLPL